MTLALTSMYPSIVCFGDSQTQYANGPGGFIASLAHAYQRKADVFNRGFSGYTTRQALFVARQLFCQSPHAAIVNVRAVIIWLGCNDSIQKGQEQHVPPEEFRSNLSSILDIVAAEPANATSATCPPPYILLLGATPVTQRAFHDNKAKQEYMTIVGEIARDARYSSKVDYIDMYSLFTTAAEPVADLLDSDGLHMSPRGYEVIFDAVFKQLRQQDGLEPSGMRLQFPDWKSFDTDATAEL
ncbi:SGNH hydrolase [Microstroma glucosiphilum]|uniref:SGNH hydrolase n=1 Tax=Pseudomicrostroma glucosiphilum TaxID=1684307 RepID=A0A316UF99_9BASI|nr:SGNH hydrolase [Pseudomicrostroma glucosiphilum]PWN23997.1 SGNH hydrolase [Pseudomicrostroma glucosiphilum]